MSAAKSTRLSHDERREQLVRLGVELLGSRGYEQISIVDIARRAGISKGLLYHYFPTKSDFVVAVLRESRDELERRMAPDPALSPAERLDANLDAFLGYVEEHAFGYLAIARARSGGDEAIREVLLEGRRARVSGLVDFAAGLAGAAREDVECPLLEAALEGWIAGCEGVVVRWLGGQDLTRDEVRHLLRHSLLGALEAVGRADSRDTCARLAEAAREALSASLGASAAV